MDFACYTYPEIRQKFYNVVFHFYLQAIEVEIGKLEIAQAKQHIRFLLSFMPDNFLRRGGKNFLFDQIFSRRHKCK